MNNKSWMPLLVAFIIAFFIWFGVRLGEIRSVATAGYSPETKGFAAANSSGSSAASSKLIYLFDLLRDRYVDTLNLSQLVEEAIPTIVEELDPHSMYIPAKDLQSINEELEGSFSGVGIQFNIQDDTVMVVQVIAGGPSEKVGMQPGDRIIAVDDSSFIGVNNNQVLKTLRGKKGTEVKLSVKRPHSSETFHFNVLRDDIPLYSVVAQYMQEDGTGYIKVDNFGANTYNEFFTALIRLKAQGAKQFLLDFRGNGGGYMEVCCQMVNEFLPKNAKIVYTEGQNSPRRDVDANGQGNFQEEKVVVLIDEWSASASEIFSGAIQDNDRGIIVGRRSFGKGLVQQQYELNDGSALRLTMARYYTPSGRCIQKPYTMGDGHDYELDIVHRYEKGEFYNADSIHLADSLKYTTVGGRTVYGGGGIMPDVFVPSDTSYVSKFYDQCISKNLYFTFAFRWKVDHQDELGKCNDFKSAFAYVKGKDVWNDFLNYAAKSGVNPTATDLARSGAFLERLITAHILRQLKQDYYYQAYNQGDATYLRGLEELKK